MFAFAMPGLGIVFGAVARHQIDRSGEPGRGLATAGFVVGVVFTALTVVAFAAYLVVVGYLLIRVGHPGTQLTPFPSPLPTVQGA